MEKEHDESTQEVKYTAEVGKIPDDGAGGSGVGKMLLMAAHPQLAQDVRAAFAGAQWLPCKQFLFHCAMRATAVFACITP